MVFHTFTCCHSCCCVHSAPIRHYSFTNFYPKFFFAVFVSVIWCRLIVQCRPYCTVPAFSPSQLLISHCQKSWSRDPWFVPLFRTADEDWWTCGCFAAHARKQVCSFVLHCHSEPLCGHRTAQKMKHFACGKNAAVKNCPCAHFHLKQNVSFQRWKNRCGSNRSCALALTSVYLKQRIH
jgi:hypothetical protein